MICMHLYLIWNIDPHFSLIFLLLDWWELATFDLGLLILLRSFLNTRVVRKNLGDQVSTQRGGMLTRCLGLQTLPYGSAHPRLTSLQTQARGAIDMLALELQLDVRVCPQHPRLGRPHARCLHAKASANPSARWLQPGVRAGSHPLPNA